MERFVIFSADGHAGADIETYRPYLERRLWDDLDALRDENEEYLTVAGRAAHPTEEAMAVFDRRGAVAAAGEFGAWDVELRLRELDAEGIAGELIHYGTQCSTSPFFGHINRPCSPELRAAGARYHRWLADFMGRAGRLFGVADPGPCVDLDETIAELRWVADHGFVSVSLRFGADPSLPSLHGEYFDPSPRRSSGSWCRCTPGGPTAGRVLRPAREAAPDVGHHARRRALVRRHRRARQLDEIRRLAVAPRPRRGGRCGCSWRAACSTGHPEFGSLTEIRADWASRPGPTRRAPRRQPIRARESRRAECASVTWSSPPSSIHRAEVDMRHDIGVDQLLFGVDYPHRGDLAEHRRLDPRRVRRRARARGAQDPGENATRACGLDRQHLADVAAASARPISSTTPTSIPRRHSTSVRASTVPPPDRRRRARPHTRRRPCRRVQAARAAADDGTPVITEKRSFCRICSRHVRHRRDGRRRAVVSVRRRRRSRSRRGYVPEGAGPRGPLHDDGRPSDRPPGRRRVDRRGRRRRGRPSAGRDRPADRARSPPSWAAVASATRWAPGLRISSSAALGITQTYSTSTVDAVSKVLTGTMAGTGSLILHPIPDAVVVAGRFEPGRPTGSRRRSRTHRADPRRAAGEVWVVDPRRTESAVLADRTSRRDRAAIPRRQPGARPARVRRRPRRIASAPTVSTSSPARSSRSTATMSLRSPGSRPSTSTRWSRRCERPVVSLSSPAPARRWPAPAYLTRVVGVGPADRH